MLDIYKELIYKYVTRCRVFLNPNPFITMFVIPVYIGIFIVIIYIFALWMMHKRPIETEIKVLVLLGALYPLGKFVQGHFWFPWWIRWYCADVGWVPCFASILPACYIAKADALKGIVRPRMLLRITILTAVVFAIIGVLVELMMLWVKRIAPNGPNTFHVAGDYVDCILYIVMCYVSIRLARSAYKKMLLNPYWAVSEPKKIRHTVNSRYRPQGFERKKRPKKQKKK